MVLKRPIRSLRVALRYWYPTRLTLGPYVFLGMEYKAHCWAWLWWNFLTRVEN